MTELGKGEQIWWGCLKILHHPARILKTWIWATLAESKTLWCICSKWMKMNAERVAALLRGFTQKIWGKKVSVFGGCLTFEQQQDANSGRLSMCAETCFFPESHKLHTPCSFQSKHCWYPARDYWGQRRVRTVVTVEIYLMNYWIYPLHWVKKTYIHSL